MTEPKKILKLSQHTVQGDMIRIAGLVLEVDEVVTHTSVVTIKGTIIGAPADKKIMTIMMAWGMPIVTRR